jgi:hypothetical protein
MEYGRTVVSLRRWLMYGNLCNDSYSFPLPTIIIPGFLGA